MVRNMLRPESNVLVKRAGSWRWCGSSELVPLDVVRVRPDKETPFPCDMVLVRGNVVVNEAMLTGESTPKWKSAIDEKELNLDEPLPGLVEESSHVVLGGTKVLEEEGEAVGVVIRTGCKATVFRFFPPGLTSP